MQKSEPSVFNLNRIVRAAGYSVAGLRAALVHEGAFRQELVLFFVLAPLGWWLGYSAIERVLLIGVLVLVLIVELLNSALEAIVDKASPDKHELAGRAKDMGSAAVFLAMMLVVFVWTAVLGARYLGD